MCALSQHPECFLLELPPTSLQVVLTAPLAKFSGQSVRNRNLLLLAGFALMVGTNCCFGMPFFANTAGSGPRPRKRNALLLQNLHHVSVLWPGC